MKSPLLALFALAFVLPAAAESNMQTLMDLQQRATKACPALMERTRQSEDYDAETYSDTECACIADKITSHAWNESDNAWTGQLMSEADARVIATNLETQQTIDDVLFELTADLSEEGFEQISDCYFKDLDDGAAADPAPATAPVTASNNNNRRNNSPPVAAAPAPAPVAKVDDGSNKPIPDYLMAYQTEALTYCPALDGNSQTPETQGYFTCNCAASRITVQAWSDETYSNSGPFMTQADGKLIADSMKSSQNMSQASSKISNGLSPDGQSILSYCYSK
ncbi:MAG TPA: hypothetical protein PLR76_11210 [Hyphomonas sp.]|nr:hypothetical protein [Hyphomonas sp.]